MNERERFVWNKLITGEFRVGVSQNLVVRALAEASGVDSAVLFNRRMGNLGPNDDFANSMLAKEAPDADVSRPYPFCLAHPLEGEVEALGDIANWQAEWKWDGIRSQLIRRQHQTFIWSRGEELVTERFPELQKLGGMLPAGIAIDGEIMPWKSGKPMAFGELQRRIGRKVTKGPRYCPKFPSRWSPTICSNTKPPTSVTNRSNGAATNSHRSCARSSPPDAWSFPSASKRNPGSSCAAFAGARGNAMSKG